MSDVFSYFLAGIIGAGIGTGFAMEGVRDIIAGDCKNFEAFVIDGKKYECRLVKP